MRHREKQNKIFSTLTLIPWPKATKNGADVRQKMHDIEKLMEVSW